MKKWLYVGFALTGVWGCASPQAAKRSEGTGSAPTQVQAEPIQPEREAGERVTKKDVNVDGQPDVWTYTVTAAGADGQERERVVRKERDINWDGRVDLTTWYDEKEQKVREAMDLDFDGKVDSVYVYEKGVNVRRERDLDGDGRPDVTLYYEKGKLVRKERDSNGDGRVDYWEYWEGDQVDRVGEDLDGDGTVDKWTRSQRSE